MDVVAPRFPPLSSATAVAALCRRFHVRRLDVFGSAATGDGFDPARSDIDLLVEFEELPARESLDAFYCLRAELEAIAGRKVDLISRAGLRNPFLRRRIERESLTIFTR